MAPSFDPIEAKMRIAGLSDAAVSAFKLNFDALAGGESGMVREEKRKRKKSKTMGKKGTSLSLSFYAMRAAKFGCFPFFQCTSATASVSSIDCVEG